MNTCLAALRLTRQLIAFDLETTGIRIGTDRIIDLALVRLHTDGRVDEESFRFHPGIPIPASATAIHHIRDEDVKDHPRFPEAALDLLHVFDDADLAGFGIARFDLPMLLAEFRRAGVAFDLTGRAILDAQALYQAFEPRNLSHACRFYCGQEHVEAHHALADVRVALEVLAAQCRRYGLPDAPEQLYRQCVTLDVAGRFCLVGGEPVFTFGKQAGRTLTEVAQQDPSYLRWLIRQPFLLPDACGLIERELAARANVRADW